MKIALRDEKQLEKFMKDIWNYVIATFFFYGLVIANTWLYSMGILADMIVAAKRPWDFFPGFNTYGFAFLDVFYLSYPLILLCFLIAIMIISSLMIINEVIEIEWKNIVKEKV